MLVAERPSEPARAPNLHVDGHLFAWLQALQRRQAAALDCDRDRVPAGAVRLDVLDAAAERLHAHLCQRRGVAGERDARPNEHDDRDDHDHGDHAREETDSRTFSTTRTTTKMSESGLGRHREKDTAEGRRQAPISADQR